MNVVRTVVLGLATAVAAGLLAGCNADENAAAPTTAKSRATQTLTVRMVGASTVSVDQHVQLASASYSVAVSPVPPESSPGDVERFRPSITHLTAQAPDQPTQRVRQVDYDTRISFDQPVSEVTLHYRMNGVAAHQRPSVPGRFLVYVTAVSVDSPGADRVITVKGALNLGCLADGSQLRLCGHQSSDGWTVHLPPDQASTAVLAQMQAT
jgi:hypothetical protein